MLQSITISDQLATWIKDHGGEIAKRLGVKSKQELLSRIYSSQTILVDCWRETQELLGASDAPAALREEGSRVGEHFPQVSPEHEISPQEWAELVSLARVIEATSVEDRDAALRTAISQGKPSPRLAVRLEPFVHGNSPAGGNQGPSPLFSWRHCGGCGLIGLSLGGPGGGILLCIVCGYSFRD
jgi:hypothetical protein